MTTALSRLPPSIFRAKRFLHLDEALGERVVAHVVGRRVDMRPFGRWNDTDPMTQLAFSGRGPGLRDDRFLVARMLDDAVVTAEVAR